VYIVVDYDADNVICFQLVVHRQFQVSAPRKKFIRVLYDMIYQVTQIVQTLIGVNQRMFKFLNEILNILMRPVLRLRHMRQCNKISHKNLIVGRLFVITLFHAQSFLYPLADKPDS
jgi:hypothetical protein